MTRNIRIGRRRNAINVHVIGFLCLGSLLCSAALHAAERPETALERRPHAKLRPVTMDEVAWTEGFWADRFQRCRTATIPAVEEGLLHPDNSEQLDVLLIAAGLKKGQRKGTHWTDGDCYKWIEAMARQYTVTDDPELARKMDHWIRVIAQAQSPDGYLSTNFWDDRDGRLQIPHHHEMYNMGHLLTAASVHHQATGKTTFLDIARRNADFLYEQFSPRPPRLVHFPWNPSAHMGLIDLYRVTGEKKYLELAGILVDNRGSSPGGGTHRNGGTDQTQDRMPLRDETQAVGHAVCATYLYCGATDLYAEIGDKTLLKALERIWEDITTKRLFLTGGVGAGSGRSTRGDPVHEAFLADHELPNDCYCETCSNIGNAMWNWRLLNVTGDARYADLMEQVLYNSGLSPVNIDQDRFFYCNPLEWNPDREPTHKHRTAQRWLVHSCYCCPPQMARTLSALQTWAYSVGDAGVWVNLYGGSKLEVSLAGQILRFTQTTDYPWSGHVRIEIDACPATPFSLMLRIPGWCAGATVTINDDRQAAVAKGGTYAELNRVWKPGDIIELDLAMPVRLVESHPNVVGNRNRVAVMRGPLVYCLELPLSEDGRKRWTDGVYFPENIVFTPRMDANLLGGIVV
ncbi:MAG: glycoside hydrolase family 127 protein, partial [Planctomycetota bacterium]